MTTRNFIEAWNAPFLTPLEKLVFLRCCDTGIDQTLVQSIRSFAEWAGCTEREICNAIDSLERLGFISSLPECPADYIAVETKFKARSLHKTRSQRPVEEA